MNPHPPLTPVLPSARPTRGGLHWPGRVVCSLLALALAATPVSAQVRIPSLGDSASDDLSVTAERRLGEQIMRELRRDPAYLDDPVLLEYLQGLWQPLVETAKHRGDIGADIQTQFAWEIFLVADRSVNAFALPGGHVGVHLGLVALTAAPQELASVLAHELSHVSQRHIARSIGQQGRQAALGVVGMILGLLVASRSNNPDAAQAAMATSQAAMIQGQLNFSRDMEREADRVGFAILSEAGFAPSGMAAMFEKLDQGSRLNDSGAFAYLRTHPLTVERLSEARLRAPMTAPISVTTGAAAPAATSAQQAAPMLLHALMRARSKVLMEPGADGWRRLADARVDAAADPAGRLAASYAAALAWAKLGEHDRAAQAASQMQQQWQSWVQQWPSGSVATPAERLVRDRIQHATLLLQAELALAARQPQLALRILGPARASQAPARAVVLLHAQAVRETAQGDAGVLTPTTAPGSAPVWPAATAAALAEAADGLQTWVTAHTGDGLAWMELSRLQELRGQRLRALRAQAEARALLGDLSAAIDLLRAAQNLARRPGSADFIEASVVDARLRDLERQRRQWAQDMRGRGGPGGRNPAPGDEAPPRL